MLGLKINPVEELLKKTELSLKECYAKLDSQTNNLNDQVSKNKLEFTEYKNKNDFAVESLNDQISNEARGIVKQKVQLKGEIQTQINKLNDFHIKTEYEFRRINSVIFSNQQMINCLLEDQQLMQLMQEQDVLDRQSIGLFGVKKNQEILGTNQNAMTNNYPKQTIKSPN